MKNNLKTRNLITIMKDLQHCCPRVSHQERTNCESYFKNTTASSSNEPFNSFNDFNIKTFVCSSNQDKIKHEHNHLTNNATPPNKSSGHQTKILSIVSDADSGIKHSHSAIQIAFNNEYPFSLYLSDDEKFKMHFTIIPSDISHRIVNVKGKYLSILVDPLSPIGERINRLAENKNVFKNIIISILNYMYTNKTISKNHLTDDSIARVLSKLTLITSQFSESDIDERIRGAKKKCIEKGGKNLSLKNLSDWIFLSKSRSQHLFKKETGVPFRRYLKWIRTLKAIEYLYSSRSNLTEAAHMAGFSDSAHLSRTFKEMFNIPPSNFIKERQAA